MAKEGALARLSQLGVFRGGTAIALGVSRKQLLTLVRAGIVERVLPDTYSMTAVSRSRETLLRAALLWAGDDAAAAGLSGELYGLEGVRTRTPEIVVPSTNRARSPLVIAHRASDLRPLLIRQHRGFRVTGVEPTLVALAASLNEESFEIACEDARRRRLTSVPALGRYVDTFGRRGQAGVAGVRRLLRGLDPVNASRSTLEVKTRRLLVANGFTDFVREFPLEWQGRTYSFDFAFERRRTQTPRQLLSEIATALAA